MVRVIATDGFHTVMDDSDAVFSVLRNGPTASINKPAEGEVFQAEHDIEFCGYAHDLEDGAIAESDLNWFLNSKAIGSGSCVSLRLAAGQHTLIFQARDTTGATAEDAVTILVVPSCWDENCPLIVKYAIATGTSLILADQPGIVAVRQGPSRVRFFSPNHPASLRAELEAALAEAGAGEDSQSALANALASGTIIDINDQARALEELYAAA